MHLTLSRPYRFHGKGTLFFPDGGKFESTWENGQCLGPGGGCEENDETVCLIILIFSTPLIYNFYRVLNTPLLMVCITSISIGTTAHWRTEDFILKDAMKFYQQVYIKDSFSELLCQKSV